MMRFLPLVAVALSSLTVAEPRIVTSTIFWGNCWTDVLAGTTTTSIPGATATYHDPSATTTTYIWYEFDKRRAELEDRDLTVVEVNQCTETDTAYVISTVRETVATLTSTITEYASTATVTFTSSCPGYDCFFDN